MWPNLKWSILTCFKQEFKKAYVYEEVKLLRGEQKSGMVAHSYKSNTQMTKTGQSRLSWST